MEATEPVALVKGEEGNFVFDYPSKAVSYVRYFVNSPSNAQSTREPIDVILQAGAVALAFATVENIFYGTFVHPNVLFFRWLFCTTGHLVYSSIWGFYCIAVYYGNNNNKNRYNYLLIIFSIFPANGLLGPLDFQA